MQWTMSCDLRTTLNALLDEEPLYISRHVGCTIDRRRFHVHIADAATAAADAPCA